MRAREALQLGEELVDLVVVSDRVAADEGRSPDDAVREESAAGRREEIALVVPQGEEGEAVAAVGIHERPDQPPLPHRLGDGLPQRPQGVIKRERAENDSETEERVAAAWGEVDSAQLGSARNRCDPRERCPEAEQRANARRVARHVESVAPADERDEQEHRHRRLLEVEPLREVGDRGRYDHGDREPPGTSPALRERPREEEQAEPERDREHSRDLGPAGRQDSLDDLDAVHHLRRQCRDKADRTNERGSPGEKLLGADGTQRHAARVQRAHAGAARRRS